MPITNTPRFAFPQWSADVDAFLTRAQLDSILSTLDSEAAQYAQGLASARPAFGIAGRFYEATDTGVVSYDTGAAWLTVGPGALLSSPGDLLQGTATPGAPARLPAPTNGRARLHWNPTTLLLEWAGDGANMLANPSGGLGLLGWLAAGGWDASRTPSLAIPWAAWNAGGYFADTTNGNAARDLFSGYGTGAAMKLGAGVDVVLSGWAHTGNAVGGGGVDLILEAFTGASWVAFATINVPNNNGTGSLYWVHGTTPAGTTQIRVHLVAHEGTAGTDIAVGRLKVEMGTAPTPYSDDAAELDALQPVCRLHTNTVTSYAPNNTFVVGNWTVDEDNYAGFDAANNRYLTPVAGLYHVEGQINIAGIAAQYPLNLLVEQNAASTGLATPQVTGNHSAAVDDVMIASDEVRCVAANAIRLALYQNSGSALSLQSAYLKIRRVAA